MSETAEQLERRLRESGVTVSIFGYVSERDVARHKLLPYCLRTLQDMRRDKAGPKPTCLNGRYFYHVGALAEYFAKCTDDAAWSSVEQSGGGRV